MEAPAEFDPVFLPPADWFSLLALFLKSTSCIKLNSLGFKVLKACLIDNEIKGRKDNKSVLSNEKS